jgi:hypothetical protein
VSQTDEKFVNVKNSWIRNSSLDDYVIAFRKKSVSIKRQFSNEKYGWRNTVAVAFAFFNNSGIALVSMD